MSRVRLAGLTALVCLVCIAVVDAGPAARKKARNKLPKRAAVGIYVLGPRAMISGTLASYRVALHWASAPGVSGPLPGAQVEVSLLREVGRQGAKKNNKPIARTRVIASGVTDGRGDVSLRFRVPKRPGRYALRVRAQSRYGVRSRSQPVRIVRGARVLVVTDKTRYQPGQTIHARVLALRTVDRRAIGGRVVLLSIRDGKGNRVHHVRVRTSRFGVASTSFVLADEVNLGSYRVSAKLAGDATHTTRSVKVERYKPPKLQVTVRTDRTFYMPGDTVRGTVRARYFFGKPRKHAAVSLQAYGSSGSYYLPSLRTDGRGEAKFSFVTRARRAGRSAKLQIVATVRDSAGRAYRGQRTTPLTAQPLRASLITPRARMVLGLPQRVYVVAGRVDGTPARGARVALRVGRKKPLTARTDALGVASFDIVVPSRNGRSVVLLATVMSKLGETAGARRWLGGQRRGVSMRLDSALVQPGGSLSLRLFSTVRGSASGAVAYLDLVKGAQTVRTFSAPLRRGKAKFSLRPDDGLSGLVTLRGYVLDKHGQRYSDQRLAYIDRSSSLVVRARADRKTYRPGERAKVFFTVSDSRSGEGVEAAIGVLGIDEAMVAMGALQPAQARRFFALSGFARRTTGALAAKPGGRTLGGWVVDAASARSKAARRARERSVSILLAAVTPQVSPLWETNPWRERPQRWRTQAYRVIGAAKQLVATELLGVRRKTGHWRFRADLVDKLVAAKRVPAALRLDPWARPVRPWHLHKVDRYFTFARVAAVNVRAEMRSIYVALRRALRLKKLTVPREKLRGLRTVQRPYRFPSDIITTLASSKLIGAALTRDPWGNAYVVRRFSRKYFNAHWTYLISRDVICSRGPDGKLGTTDDVLPAGPTVVVGAAGLFAARAGVLDLLRGAGGFGLHGSGRGGGGVGAGTIGLGTLGTIGHGGGGGGGVRVRSYFPETLLFEPQLVTDKHGRASMNVPLADSITQWRLVATASTVDGRVGETQLGLRVFQKFFVDVDVPRTLTEGDRVSVPVTVHNYLKQRQRVKLVLRQARWMSATSGRTLLVEMAPSAVKTVRFSIVARHSGQHALRVDAASLGGDKVVRDSVRRDVLVEPDGVTAARVRGGLLSAKRAVRHTVALPAEALANGRSVSLELSPGAVSTVMKGLSGMLRMPGGCFEQTSSTTYPNVLVLDYMRRTKQSDEAIERKAKRYIGLGYQRLVSFEVPGGGYSWFGRAPANKVLTAYGLMEFRDMSRVHPVDEAMIARTQRWLAKQQSRDGSFKPDARGIQEGATNHYQKNVLRITAYVAHALRYSGYRGKRLERALAYVRRNAASARDPYTVALLGALFKDEPRRQRGLLATLWSTRQRDKKGVYFAAPKSSLTYGRGNAATLESTALAALAYLSAPRADVASLHRAAKIVARLHRSKDAYGSFYSTQATILGLRALLAQHERTAVLPTGVVELRVDGAVVKRLSLAGDQRAHSITLAKRYARGRHRVALTFAGKGQLSYQLVSRYWVPSPNKAKPSKQALAIATRTSVRRARPGQSVTFSVDVRNGARSAVDMPLVDLALPPGFEVRESDLTQLVRRRRVAKIQRVGNRALLYLTKLGAKGSLKFSVHLRARHPLAVKARPSLVYEYYRPENRAHSTSQRLEVL